MRMACRLFAGATLVVGATTILARSPARTRVELALPSAVGAGVPVGEAVTSDGAGAWLARADGTVTAAGDAVPYGDASGIALNAPVVAIAATPSGRGYWLLGGDGGVFSYGDARFLGSTGRLSLNQPVLQLVPTPTGAGYWLVARDGGVFAFGDARFAGSEGGARLAAPVVGMAATPTGAGYWLVARDGGVFAFGDAPFAGAAKASVPAIGVLAGRSGGGYWVIGGDGALTPFGGERFAVAGVATDGFSLAGQVVTIDPGHNGGNGAHPEIIDQPVPSGPGQTKACDTTGTATDGGYPESAFAFDVAGRLAGELRRRAATVVMTRQSDDGVGPCIDRRAAIGNSARADAAISIHGDGGPPTGRGFAVLEPALFPGYNDSVVGPSSALGAAVRDAFAAVMPTSSYLGSTGLEVRADLGGLNLSTVAKVLIECGNMRNSSDAGLMQDPAWRQSAARALALGLSRYLIGPS